MYTCSVVWSFFKVIINFKITGPQGRGARGTTDGENETGQRGDGDGGDDDDDDGRGGGGGDDDDGVGGGGGGGGARGRGRGGGSRKRKKKADGGNGTPLRVAWMKHRLLNV